MSAKKRTAPKILDDPEEITDKRPPAPVRTAHDAREDDAAEKRRQEAFDAVPQFRGQPLEPFSVSRENVFLALRTALGAPRLVEAMRDGADWWPDAQRLLWLCSHPPEAWEDLRRDPAALQRAIDRWSEDRGLRADKLEIGAIAIRLWVQSQENAHIPASDGKARPPGN